VLVLSPSIEGTLRASQISPAHIHFFTVEPRLLFGLATFGERRVLEEAAAKPELSFQLIAASEPIAERFRQILCECRNRLRLRLHLLQLFLDSLGQSLEHEAIADSVEADAKKRLEVYLQTLPEWGLVDLTFGELAEQARCTPRHLNRVFRKLMGKPFREKQLELRLARAKELLATTQLRIRQVALESGFQSPNLFNGMFKRQIGISPGKWRRLVEKHEPTKSFRPRSSRLDRNTQGTVGISKDGPVSRHTGLPEVAISTASLAASRDACPPPLTQPSQGI
jgi:AraC-like DNA-binding protein